MDDIFTIAPPPLFCIISIAYLIQNTVPKRSVWNCSNQSFNKPGLNSCALFIKMSKCPYELTVKSIRLFISLSLLMSAVKKVACPPCFLICSTVSSSPGSLISDTTTCSPSLANFFAIARPQPSPPEPVTITVLFLFNSLMIKAY
jgi:hypothetical protein